MESLPIARTTSAGVAVGRQADPANAQAGPSQNEEDAATAAAGGAVVAHKVPFYKKRWFIISQVIAVLIGIALLFVILFPVVGAIAQHVVDVSVLNVDTVAIVQPSNTS